LVAWQEYSEGCDWRIWKSGVVVGVTRRGRRWFPRPCFAVVAEGTFTVEDGFLVRAIVLLAGFVASAAAISRMGVAL